MIYKKNLVLWYEKKLSKIYIKLNNKMRLTDKEKFIYEMLEEYDFYAPRKYR